MNLLKQISAYYWGMCLLKETPDKTPYSLFLFNVSGLLFILVIMTQWHFSDAAFASDLLLIFGAALSLVLSFVIYSGAILFFRSLQARLLQTVTSLLFTHSIIHLLAMPLFLFDPYLNHQHLKNPIFLLMGVIYLLISLGLSVWEFVITAHIYKYALNTTSTQSVLAAFGLLAANILTVSFWR